MNSIKSAYRSTLLECGLLHSSVKQLSRERTTYITANSGNVSQELVDEMYKMRLKRGLSEMSVNASAAGQGGADATSSQSLSRPANVSRKSRSSGLS